MSSPLNLYSRHVVGHPSTVLSSPWNKCFNFKHAESKSRLTYAFIHLLQYRMLITTPRSQSKHLMILSIQSIMMPMPTPLPRSAPSPPPIPLVNSHPPKLFISLLIRFLRLFMLQSLLIRYPSLSLSIVIESMCITVPNRGSLQTQPFAMYPLPRIMPQTLHHNHI